MIDWYALVLERSRRFYITFGFLVLLVSGLAGLAIYRYVDKTHYLMESVALYDALNISDTSKSKEALHRIVGRKIEPYSSIAAMQLSWLLVSADDEVQRSEIYERVSLESPSVYVRELAQLNVQITDGNVDPQSVYAFTARFLDAFMRFSSGHEVDEVRASLSNVVAAIDANPYVRDLASKLLKAISE
ncbi:hypothetical protein NHE_0546 [Neorickettsia helminthoeca str. Oregon]|uniref:Tetratricopeptide repeat-like domain-containing protein n=1 Tax=Neorickettsia helminthoeca str. Oregon TaxID=1286528 RepID=X5H4J7_9RICK|nr:hypothetical protein [Neorickettsia helminthoeca]AHX11486.1 hypothetical protein NHE_0546 [Neorickettsia helminthoeca str. Oregon]